MKTKEATTTTTLTTTAAAITSEIVDVFVNIQLLLNL